MIVFYGSAPEEASEIAKIAAPVYGFYGENEQRINTGIPATEEKMRKAGKTYEKCSTTCMRMPIPVSSKPCT